LIKEIHPVPEKVVEQRCTLCGCDAVLFVEISKKYFKCINCSSIFLSEKDIVSPEEEKARYEEHNNDVNDPGYRSFVKPLTDMVREKFSEYHAGLDFGCGTGPVIATVLKEQGFNIKTYDPIFVNRPELLRDRYDYIVCCEVAEHFHDPYKEFGLLRNLLKEKGSLYVMTDFFGDRTENDFRKWYYKDDQTHIFFYHEKAFKWIKNVYGFRSIEKYGRLIVLNG
jgi:SAM-dependent methyltransferase